MEVSRYTGMEFYREKIIRTAIETQMTPEKIIEKLSQHVAIPPKWYKFKSPFADNDKPYEGKIAENTFYLFKKNYLNITGAIHDKENRSVIAIEMKDDTRPVREPVYWAGKKTTAVAGITVQYLGLLVLLTALFQVTAQMALLIAALVIPAMCYVVWKTNNTYLPKLITKAEEESRFLAEIFQGNLIEIKK